jgi:hypothetical protein
LGLQPEKVVLPVLVIDNVETPRPIGSKRKVTIAAAAVRDTDRPDGEYPPI